jgi:hypothetical protein
MGAFDDRVEARKIMSELKSPRSKAWRITAAALVLWAVIVMSLATYGLIQTSRGSSEGLVLSDVALAIGFAGIAAASIVVVATRRRS